MSKRTPARFGRLARCSGGGAFAGGLLLLGLLAACGGSNPNLPPDARFGHRYEGEAPDQRKTVVITPPDEDVSYLYYLVYVDTLHVRPAPFMADVPKNEQKVPVELLVKGSFSNGCSELDEARQERAGHIITINLITRWPQGGVCADVHRPFRFYLNLPGRYGPGNYTIKINDEAYAFSIEPLSES